MTFVWFLLNRFWPYLVAIALAAFLFWKAEGWCNSACKDARVAVAVQKDRADTAEQKLAELDRARIKQMEQWNAATAAEEERSRRDASSRAERFAPIRDRVSVDPVVAAAVLPPVLAGVLADAYAAAEPAGAAAGATDTATPNPSAAAWLTDTLAWEAECRDRVSAWERFYQSLRSAQ